MATNLYAANAQWSTRPADERFWGVDDALTACRGYAETAEEVSVDFGTERILPNGGDLILTLDGGKGDKAARFTHWGFGQMARLASAPPDYLRQLTPALAAQCIEDGLDRHFAGRDKMTSQALVHSNGSTVLRSLTSEIYSRYWNWQVFEKLAALQPDGWRTPPARPSSTDDPRARRATEADVLTRKSTGGGLSIKVGDMIAPAGVYASDHDMFAFMVNEEYRVEDGSDGGLSRGFFVSNSEVGAAGLKVCLFYYRHVCGNHIVWDASNVVDINVRHVGDVQGRFQVEMTGALDAYLKRSIKDDAAKIKRAKGMILGQSMDEILDSVFKAVTKGRRNGLPSGLNLKQLAAAHALAVENEATDGNPASVWGYVQGMTRLSQMTPFADQRMFLDRAASTILALAV